MTGEEGRAGPKRRYRPSDKALRALQLTYELQILPTPAYDWIFGSKANRSEQLQRLVEAGLLASLDDPLRRPGRVSQYYAVLPAAYDWLRPLQQGQRRPPYVALTPERILAPGTQHLLAVGTFALACLYGLPEDLAPDWHGEPSARLTFTRDDWGKLGTYVEPDGVLLTATGVLASSHPAVFYECDWGSMHWPKWQPKIRRYARARDQGAHIARYGAAWPPLLVTCRTPESVAEIARYLSRGMEEEYELRDWDIWIACYRDVAGPALIAAHAWRQVRHANEDDPLYKPLWPLEEILRQYKYTPRAWEAHQAEAARIEAARQKEARESSAPTNSSAIATGSGTRRPSRRSGIGRRVKRSCRHRRRSGRDKRQSVLPLPRAGGVGSYWSQAPSSFCSPSAPGAGSG